MKVTEPTADRYDRERSPPVSIGVAFPAAHRKRARQADRTGSRLRQDLGA